MNQSNTLQPLFAVTVLILHLCHCFQFSSAAPVQEAFPETPAGISLSGLVNCLNETDAEVRKTFLKDGFAKKDELQNRIEITSELHRRFAPLSLHKVLESKPNEIVAHLSVKTEELLEVTLTLAEGTGKISDISMGPAEDDTPVQLAEGYFRLIREDGTTLPEAQGVWKAKGYGYVFEVKERSAQVYNVTKSYGWKQELEDELLFQKGKDIDHIIFTFHPLEPGYNMTRLERLPDTCTTENDWTPEKLFDVYVEIFDQHYPFFESRNFDWKARLKATRPTISKSSTELELFNAMQAMIADLDDGHVGLSAEIDGDEKSARTGGEDTLSRLRASFKPTDDVKTYRRYFRKWLETMRSELLEGTLKGNGKVVANEQLIWGRPHEKIGYLFIGGMGGYTIGSIDSQTEELHKQLNHILSELNDTDALIVDISFNGGGSDLFSLEIASHFTEKKKLGFSKWPASNQEYRQDRFVVPYLEKNPEGTIYTKPIYLMTNDVTASAAEIFTMCMRSMPHVTTVGLATEGALSDVLPKTLPNGWELGLSNEIYVDHEGVCHEGPGVPPQINMPIFDPADITKIGHSESVMKVVEMALKNSK